MKMRLEKASGTGTNLKVGAPVQSKSGGTINTVSRLGERLRDSQYSLASCLYAVLLLTVPSVSSYL